MAFIGSGACLAVTVLCAVATVVIPINNVLDLAVELQILYSPDAHYWELVFYLAPMINLYSNVVKKC